MIFVPNENPSPSHYNAYKPYKIPNGFIEDSTRTTLANKAIAKYPSPDKYSGEEVLRKTRNGIGFVKEPRSFSLTKDYVPGPGTY